MRKFFTIVGAIFIMHGYFWWVLHVCSLLHPAGYIKSPSISGRTHYEVLRPEPFYQYYRIRDWNKVHWCDLLIPVILGTQGRADELKRR